MTVGTQVSWSNGVAAAHTNGVLGAVLMLPSTCISQVAPEGKCSSVHFVCSELDFQQMVLSKQGIAYFGVETCCMVESLERHFGFHASIHLSFWHAAGCRQWQSVFSIRYDLEKHPQQWPICDVFVLDSPWAAHSCL